MASITIKDIPPKVHERLKLRARANHRSLQQEIIACLEQVVMPRRLSVEEEIERVRKFRESIGHKIDLSDLDTLKREGRE
jgi:plasmid stability protein